MGSNTPLTVDAALQAWTQINDDGYNLGVMLLPSTDPDIDMIGAAFKGDSEPGRLGATIAQAAHELGTRAGGNCRWMSVAIPTLAVNDDDPTPIDARHANGDPAVVEAVAVFVVWADENETPLFHLYQRGTLDEMAHGKDSLDRHSDVITFLTSVLLAANMTA